MPCTNLAIFPGRAGMPGIKSVSKLRSRIGTTPGSFVKLMPEIGNFYFPVDTIVDAANKLMTRLRIILKVNDLLHKIIGQTNRVVTVLTRNCLIGLTVHISIVSHFGQSSYFILFCGLPHDEILNFRMVNVKTDHFGSSSGCTT
jgi:hypothetical protein